MIRLGFRFRLAAVVLLVAYGADPATTFAQNDRRGPPRRDFIREQNERVDRIPEADRAWPLLIEARARFVEWTTDGPDAAGPDEIDPSDPRWPRVVRWLLANQPSLMLAREAARREHLALPWSFTLAPDYLAAIGALPMPPAPAFPPTISIVRPHLQELRRFARALQVDAVWGASEGDADRAVFDILALIDLARLAHQGDSTLEQSIAASVHARACRTIALVTTSAPRLLRPDQLEQIQRRLEGLLPRRRMTLSFAGERMIFNDVIQRLYPGASPRPDADALASLLHGGDTSLAELAPEQRAELDTELALMASRDETLRAIDRIHRRFTVALRRPLWDFQPVGLGDEVPRIRADFAPADPLRHMPIDYLEPALTSTYAALESATAWHDASLTIIALQRYLRDTGRYPDLLIDLIPAYLDRLPIDRFAGQPLMYRLSDEGEPLLYSVGADLDDDNGAPAGRGDPSIWVGPGRNGAPDGDWVFFPQR